ncbi:hypothetical protein H4219_006046 [Mycoemilia scoparia]|uniref:Uncharacterized protein n=1 Tax=Mycoemilia scoparia TaxID=417184 RepID=A0A9W7ZUW0_9FUNG|nr:hypothetical protein H4219_006046 [Mycoemilia scoparia]
MNSLAPPALPLLLKSNFIYLKVTQVVSQIPSDALTEKLGNLTSKGSVDNIVFMARQIYDGQYLWEKVYKDKYMPEDRAYEYVSNWGHASDNYRIDGGYPRSTPMPGKTLDVVGLDGFLSSIKCHVVNCDGNDDCSPKTVVSDIQRTQAPNRMGITNLEFYNNYSGIQYQVFWGSDSKNGSAINVSGQDTTGMIREAKIDNKMDAEGGYSGNSQLSPGSIKVNCDYTVLNKNGKNDSTPLVVTNTEFFNYNPFADIIFTQGSSNITLGEDTLHSLLSEENILRNLTYGIQNSFRLLNTRLFRSLQANLLQSNLGLGSGFIEWGVESNLRGYDSWIIIYASIFLSIILLLNILDFALMDDENYMLPVSYTQDINTRLSVLALSGIPPSDEYEKLFRYSFGSRRNSMIEMYQKIETLIHQKIGGLGGNGQRMDEGVLFAWENGVFLPHYDEPKYKRIMKRKGLNPTRSIVIHIPPDLNLSNATTAVEQQPDNYLTSNGRGAA